MSGGKIRRVAFDFIAPPLDEVDVIHRVVSPAGPGVMVDVGAHVGGALMRFAQEGWRVFAVEPDPANRARLLRRVHAFANVTVDDRAVADQDGLQVDLYTSQVSTGISTLTPFHPSHVHTATVKTVRLDTLLVGVDQVTVLKTDTEGHDLPVLKTFPWLRLRPSGVVAEFEDRKTWALDYDMRDMAEYLSDLGYVVFVSEWYPIVEYGQRHRWRSLRQYPVALANPNGWGNLIAVDQGLAAEVSRYARWPSRFRALAHRARARLWRSG